MSPDSAILIAQVGPYPPQKNGIGDYTSDLARALRERSPGISTLALACRIPEASGREPGVWRCWDPRSDWPAELIQAVDEARPQIVHIQHGLYMGHDGRTERFLAGLRARRIPAVVTLHGIWPTSPVRRWPRRFHHALGRSADRIVVHQRAGSIDVLLADGVPAERITVIPHGTGTAPDADRGLARRTLGLSDRPAALFAGFIFRRKGLHVAVRAFERVARDVPGARLLAVGSERKSNPIDRLYIAWLHRLMRRGRKAGWLDFRPGHVSEEELSLHMASADVVVFPYLRRYGSASGVFHRALAAGRPVICSDVPAFAEAIEAWGRDLPELVVPPGDIESWSRALTEVFSRDGLRAKAADASGRLGRANSWPSAAEQHLRMYRELLASGP